MLGLSGTLPHIEAHIHRQQQKKELTKDGYTLHQCTVHTNALFIPDCLKRDAVTEMDRVCDLI